MGVAGAIGVVLSMQRNELVRAIGHSISSMQFLSLFSSVLRSAILSSFFDWWVFALTKLGLGSVWVHLCIVIEFGVTEGRVVLRVVNLLVLIVSHLASLLVSRELVWVEHREHLGETLTDSGNSLSWVSEWKFVPSHELDSLSVHVLESLLAGCAGKSLKWLLAEHSILLILAATTASGHDDVVKVLQLLLMDLESLSHFSLISELLR